MATIAAEKKQTYSGSGRGLRRGQTHKPYKFHYQQEDDWSQQWPRQIATTG